MSAEAGNPDLPWGWWLRLDGSGNTDLVDRDGRRWRSVREAFWTGRLGMGEYRDQQNAEYLEILLAVLLVEARRIPRFGEVVQDLFEGKPSYYRFFRYWVEREGFTAMSSKDGGTPSPVITAEGRAVMLMLGMTRPRSLQHTSPGRASVHILAELGRGIHAGEERRRIVEEGTAGWRTRFLRDTIAGKPIVSLASFDTTSGMPIVRTVWTLGFDDVRGRDAFFDWVCDRLDRWEYWADLAFGTGGDTLSRHLIRVLTASTLTPELLMAP